MERHQRRHGSPGREYREGASRRPYSDEQETYRNPRNEYRDDDRNDGGNFESRRYGSASGRDDRYLEPGEQNRYGASERGYGYGDTGYEGDYMERDEPGYGARRTGQGRDTWEEPEEGNFSDARSRWPRDDRYRSEPRSQNWPHSRGGSRVSEYGYFQDEAQRSGYGTGQQGGSRYGFGDRPPRASGYGYGGQQEGYSGEEGGSEFGWGGRQQGGYAGGRHQDRSGSGQGGTGYGNRRFDEDYSGLGPRNYSRSDERIKEDICDELSADPQCNAEDIEIEVRNGEVTLSGSVPSRKMKHRAEDIADAARGVKDVDNRIRVTRSASQKHSRGGREQDDRERGENGASSNGASKVAENRGGNQPSSRSARSRNK